jgi:HlyD family secretion protein
MRFPLNQRFSAEIAYINPAVDVLRGSVEVKLNALAPPRVHLRQDMTVSVDIDARRARFSPATDVIQ